MRVQNRSRIRPTGHHRLRFRLASVALACGIAASAAAPLRSQSQANPSFADVEQRATEARQAKDLEQAVALYRAGLTLRPDWSEGRWYLGTSLFGLKHFGDARDVFLQVAAAQPGNAQAWALAGMCEFELGETGPALDHLTRSESVGLNASDELAALVRFRIALLLNRGGESRQAIDRLIPIVLAGNFQQVVEALGFCVLRAPLLPSQVPPQDQDLYIKAGEAMSAYVKHDTTQAAKSFAQLVAAYPDRANVHYAYGVFLLETSPDEALQEFERELALNPSHLDALSHVAQLYLKQGAPEKALPYARRAVQADPASAATRSLLGESLLDSGNTPQAIQELESAVKLEPEIPHIHFLLASAYKHAGNGVLATQQMIEFQRLDALQNASESGATPLR